MISLKLISLFCVVLVLLLTACDDKSEPDKTTADDLAKKSGDAPAKTPESKPAAAPKEPEKAPEQAPAPAPKREGPPQVVFEIVVGDASWGQIVLELNEQKAPITVKNFLDYVDKGFFDGTIFHRVIPNFMIQGGGFTSPTDHKPAGANIKSEAQNGLKNFRGTIAMARGDHPDSATSQFFINVNDNPPLDYPNAPGGLGYCVFGKVVKGMEVVDRIKSVETRPNPNPAMRGEKSMPINPPVIKKARRS